MAPDSSPPAAHTSLAARAARVHAFGGVDAIVFEEVELPAPGPDEVVVGVKAASVGPWDGWIRSGHSALPQPLPLTLGSDLSGIVEQVGQNVTAFQPGDEVFGVTNPRFVGAYATRAIADAGMIALKPSGLSHIEAASLPVVATTASQALFEHAKLRQNQSVLIHGGAGNVGAYAVQLAHRAGLRVFATGSHDDLQELRANGADTAIDYRATAFEDIVRDVDAVIDLVGGETQRRSFAVLKRGGTMVSAVSKPDGNLARERGVQACFFLVEVRTAVLTTLASMIECGELRVSVGTVLRLADAQLAHEMLEGTRPHLRGKIVLSMEG